MYWWKNSFLNVKRGKVYLGDEEAIKIVQEYGTPLYVYGKKQILLNFRRLLDVFSEKTQLEVRLYYAMKANSHQEILKTLEEADAFIDAVSPGEVDKALQAGFSGQKIIFTGTSVSSGDLQRVFIHDHLTVNIDAVEQLELMQEVKEKWFKDQSIRVSVRWNPGIGRGFSSKAVTAGERAYDGTPVKFGIEEKKVISVFQKAREYGFAPVGLHQHLGSGWTIQDFDAVQTAVDKMIQMATEIQNQGFNLEFLDFGGGFGPKYSEHQEPFPVQDYARYICEKVKNSDLKIKAIAVEPGKYLVGDAGVLLVKVEYIKKSYNNLFACVNAGTFNTVPRPAIYEEAYHHIINCSRLGKEKKEKITVAGNLCETGDIFCREIIMPIPKRGDILAVLNAGAYCRSMASNFNLREIPKEIIV